VSGVLAGTSAGSSAASKGQKNYGGNRDPYYAPTTYENYGTYDYKPVSIFNYFLRILNLYQLIFIRPVFLCLFEQHKKFSKIDKNR